MANSIKADIEVATRRITVMRGSPSDASPRCPVCHGAGRIGWDLSDYGPCSECELGMAGIGVPERFRGARLEDFGACADDFGLREWKAEPPGWYIHGPVGAGKSHLAAALSRHAVEFKRQVRFVEVNAFLDLIRRSYGDPERQLEVRWVQEQVARADLVVLDDLGGERATGWASEQMLTLVNGLYNRKAALIVTSNLTPQDLAEGQDRGGGQRESYLEPRTVSRLFELTRPLKLDHPDRRLAARG